MSEASGSACLSNLRYSSKTEAQTAAMKPNLFIIGSMKSGTTLLWRLLASHPAIHMSTPKEPSYFVEPNQLRELQPWIWSQGYWRSQKIYLDLFKTSGSKTYAGEASVYYTHLPLATGVADRIMRFSPSARLIYIMRDPVERTISHYWHRVIHNNECRPIEVAIKNDRQYCDVSHYSMQLAPYYKHFSNNQIKLLTLEQIIDNYDETVRSLFCWLEVDDTITKYQLKRENETPNIVRQRMELWSRTVNLLRRSPVSRASIDLLPESIKYYVRRLFTREINLLGIDIDPVMEYLQPLQRQQTKELSALTGREFREWKALNS